MRYLMPSERGRPIGQARGGRLTIQCFLTQRPFLRFYRDMSSLKTSLESLAATFAADVVRAIQGTSLKELSSEVGGASKRGRPAAVSPSPKGVKPSTGGRLQRRSAADIGEALDKIVTLLKGHKQGLRAEQIRQGLHMQAKEMPRVLSEGLVKRKLKKKGQKRATTYFAT
jgi:hypothetical protein